ncbi:hypothetical protein JWG40_14865 [Leptospira sp. 201903074]|uniref:hypothetical protein n=1 Tax=Leptospira abararensis TaxID=2810036 RepID=UPI0019664232|nr:hypothetical protein [Leptospira abararensis]MBM9548308.1 hypothetical protein [Leptospira abararensis]
MHKSLLLIGILSTSLWSNPTPGFGFPTISREGTNTTDPNTAWQIQTRITPEIDGQNIFSIQYHTDGKSVIIGTTNFYIYRISLLDGSLIWKVETKMHYQKEFDGPKIFDVSPDGKTFLSFGQTDPDRQASERYLVVRSSNNGSITKKFPAEFSKFYSITADIDYRYPGYETKINREAAGLSPNWIQTIDSAKYIDSGRKILVSYKHNMDGPHFYDRRFVIYETNSGKKINEFQLTSDPNSADWTQPAGFEIAHYQFPYQYVNKRNTIIYGNAHGRIHEINELILVQNSNIPLVEEKPAGPIVYIPLSSSPDLETKDRQTIRSVTVTPDGKILYCSAGVEAGYIQVYGYNLETKKELFRSSFFDAGELFAPSNDILIIGGLFSSGKFNIVDTKKGILVFASNEDDNYIHPQIFSVHPKLREVLALSSGRELQILRPQGAVSPW